MIGIDYNIVKRQGWKVGKNLINMKSGRNENVEILGKLVEWNIEAIIGDRNARNSRNGKKKALWKLLSMKKISLK